MFSLLLNSENVAQLLIFYKIHETEHTNAFLATY